jgi:heme/copper-type cytochrome/quinol oxidase subunit 2
VRAVTLLVWLLGLGIVVWSFGVVIAVEWRYRRRKRKEGGR